LQVNRISSNLFLITTEENMVNRISLSGKNKNIISCTCKDFSFKRKCEHINYVKEILLKEGKKVTVKSESKNSYSYIDFYKKSLRRLLEIIEEE
jgi:quinolinate synthase